MKYELIISEIAESDILKLRKSGDKSVLLKLNNLLNELREHPYSGTGGYFDDVDPHFGDILVQVFRRAAWL